MSELDKVTSALDKAYNAWKKSEKQKNKVKDQFFEEAVKQVEDQTLAQVTVEVDVTAEDEAPAWVEKMYPTWRLLEVTTKNDKIRALLEEDPFYKPFAYVNPETGKVYERQIASGSPYLDDTALREEDPELWEKVTEETRVLRPIELLPAKELAAIQKYFRYSKPTVKLAAPRKAKPEELAEPDEDNN